MIPSLIISFAVAVLVYFTSMGINTWSRAQAVAKCMQSSKVETTISQPGQVQKYSQPDGGWYETCMKDTGLRVKGKK
jgi:hypothetical protein